MPCIDPYHPAADIGAMVARVEKDAEKVADSGEVEWTFKGVPVNAVLGQLLTPSTTAGMLSTHFSGYERYHEKCHKAVTPAENWAKVRGQSFQDLGRAVERSVTVVGFY